MKRAPETPGSRTIRNTHFSPLEGAILAGNFSRLEEVVYGLCAFNEFWQRQSETKNYLKFPAKVGSHLCSRGGEREATLGTEKSHSSGVSKSVRFYYY
jgi:hypothetical protein